MWKLQIIYNLEPAGSHGVYGLDDYQHIAFIIGAGQLAGQSEWTPNSIHDEKIVKFNEDDYIYFSCIAFIKKVKSGAPFYESSPILNDVSGCPNWNKVAGGMVKMFQGEVLSKFPIVQHLWFGSLLTL